MDAARLKLLKILRLKGLEWNGAEKPSAADPTFLVVCEEFGGFVGFCSFDFLSCFFHNVAGGIINFLLHFKLIYLEASTMTLIIYNVIFNRCTSVAMKLNRVRRQLQLIDNDVDEVVQERTC